MLNNIPNFDLDIYVTICYTLSVVGMIGLTVCFIYSYRQITYVPNVTPVRQIDTTRVEEGLPTDISLSPEDFRDNPELAEIFGITDSNTNLDVALESNEHFEQVQNQELMQQIQNQLTTVNTDNFTTANDIINIDYLITLYNNNINPENIITYFRTIMDFFSSFI